MSHGFQHWLLQRVSAVYMAFFIIACLLFFSLSNDLTYQQWRGYFNHPLVIILSGLFCFSLIYHAWVGLKDVVIDYVHHAVLRTIILAILGFFLLGGQIWLFGLLFHGFSH